MQHSPDIAVRPVWPVMLAWSSRRNWLVVAGALVLCAYYVQQYLKLPMVPGAQPAWPLGWWGWFDQSMTLKSARALAAGDLSAGQHWYPLGYSILGAVFWPVLRGRGFVLVDLASLLVTYAGVVAFAQRIRVRPLWSVPVFLLATMGDRILFEQWVIPWNTIPTAALLWALLALAAAHMDGQRRPFLLGAVACAVPLFRPTDALLAAPCVLAALLADLRHRRLHAADLLRFGAGVALPAVPYLCLYLAIYGPHPSEYMLISRRVGFTLHDLGWKAYVVLVDPRAWFGGGEGLLERCPWIVLAFAGVIPALLRGRAAALLAVVLILHGLLYLTYVDLLPSGFWRYDNLHYWSVAFPGYALLAFLLLRDLFDTRAPRRRVIGWAALAATMLVLCVRIVPARADGEKPAKAIDFRTGDRPFDHVYFDAWLLRDRRGTMRAISDMRAVPIAGGMRVIALRRAFAGDAVLTDAHGVPLAQSAPPLRWQAALRFGWPRWLFLPVGHGLFDPINPGP